MPRLLVEDRSVEAVTRTETVPRPQVGRWVGELKGVGGSVKDFGVKFEVSLSFPGVAIAGMGRMESDVEDDGLSLDGVRSGRAVDLDMWLQHAPLSYSPLVCVGETSEEGDRIDGAFTVVCQSPSTCHCGGGSGEFRLWREDA